MKKQFKILICVSLLIIGIVSGYVYNDLCLSKDKIFPDIIQDETAAERIGDVIISQIFWSNYNANERRIELTKNKKSWDVKVVEKDQDRIHLKINISSKDCKVKFTPNSLSGE